MSEQPRRTRVPTPQELRHKCVSADAGLAFAWCCYCLGKGPDRETVEERLADAEHHMTVGCGDAVGGEWEGAPYP